METEGVPGDLSDEIKRVIEQEANAGTEGLSTETGYESIGVDSILFHDAINKVILATGMPGDDVTSFSIASVTSDYESRFGINSQRVFEAQRDELPSGQILEYTANDLYRCGLKRAYDLSSKKKASELRQVDLQSLAELNGYSAESFARHFGTSDPDVIRSKIEKDEQTRKFREEEGRERRAVLLRRMMPYAGAAMGFLAVLESASKAKVPITEYMKTHPMVTVGYLGGGFVLGTGVGMTAMEMAKPVHNGVKFITSINRFRSG